MINEKKPSEKTIRLLQSIAFGSVYFNFGELFPGEKQRSSQFSGDEVID
jgi:hypothetical protein